jgi:hypothetical protein
VVVCYAVCPDAMAVEFKKLSMTRCVVSLLSRGAFTTLRGFGYVAGSSRYFG